MSQLESSPSIHNAEWHVDDRGFLAQIFDNRYDIKRLYVLGNFQKHTIRGFHFHNFETKYFFVIKGAAKFITIHEKDSDGSKRESFVISDRSPAVLQIPPKFYQGWISLEDETIVAGMSNRTLKESEADDIRVDPFKFGDIWIPKSR